MTQYMFLADVEARRNLTLKHGGPFGAVVVKDGAIIATGHNQVLKDNDPTAHAEIVAIRNACKELGTFDLTGCELYTSCYPCPMCLSAIIWANIKTVYYGNTKEDADSIGFRDDFIYKYITDVSVNNDCDDVLKLVPCGRDETIKTFDDFRAISQDVKY